MYTRYTKRQLEILNITIDYISKNGIKSFSLRNIADAIGIKQPSLYVHFDSKEKILIGIFDVYKNEILSYHNDLAALNTTKLKKIKMYFLKMSEFIQYKPDYMNLVWIELYQHRDLFREDLDFLWKNMIAMAEQSLPDKDIRNDIDYEWLIVLIQGTLKVFLERKLVTNDFDVLSNADQFWAKLETLLKDLSL